MRVGGEAGRERGGGGGRGGGVHVTCGIWANFHNDHSFKVRRTLRSDTGI